MNKIPTLFVRDFENNPRHVTREVTPGCEWVLAGQGIATRKYDGTCVAMLGGAWWARREVKPGKSEPDGFVPLSHDDETGKTVGWEPAEQSAFWKWMREAFVDFEPLAEGTYELCGPKVNGNPEGYGQHVLIRHQNAARYPVLDAPHSFAMIRGVIELTLFEGIVWHHPDGRMAKIKRRDFA